MFLGGQKIAPVHKRRRAPTPLVCRGNFAAFFYFEKRFKKGFAHPPPKKGIESKNNQKVGATQEEKGTRKRERESRGPAKEPKTNVWAIASRITQILIGYTPKDKRGHQGAWGVLVIKNAFFGA